MKKLWVLSTIVIVFSLLMLINARVVAAYELLWPSIQHRVYDYKPGFNNLAFNLKDGSGNFVSDASTVNSVILRYPKPNGDPDPSGTPVQLGTLAFEYWDYIAARFDTVNAEWIYDSAYPLSQFDAEFQGTLVTGTYTIEVTTNDMVTHIQTIEVEEIINRIIRDVLRLSESSCNQLSYISDPLRFRRQHSLDVGYTKRIA